MLVTEIFMYSCRRELQEELGVTLPKDAFEKIFVFLQEWLVLGILNFVSMAFSFNIYFLNHNEITKYSRG